MSEPRGAHLVGSVNLADTETVLRTAAGVLGDRLRRIPDGETGHRHYWIAFQPGVLETADGLERVGEPVDSTIHQDFRPLRIADGVRADDLRLPPLGYADAALDSYAVFRRLRDEGIVPAGVRFQVSLPTPFAIVSAFIVPSDRAAFEPVYAAAMFAELDRILAAIPHDDLAVQWDTAVEFQYIENLGYGNKSDDELGAWFDDVWTAVVARASEQLGHVPDDVEAGFHLCYGDVAEAHFVEPADAANLAEYARRVLAAAPRRVDWFHLPVPIERDDAEYFAPLAALVPELAGTELHLGLVHREDGVAGARRRIDAALTHVPAFGVGTECGLGRAPAGTAADILAIHREVTAAW